MTTTTYLALYTGPHGPISAMFAADSLADAVEHIAANSSRWYDNAEDVLWLDDWTLVQGAQSTGDYAIYVRAKDGL